MRGIPRIAWVGLAILAIAAILLSLGKRETQAFPAADSFAPSGASAFSELLRAEGYQVVISREQRPKLKSSDLAIAFDIPKELPFLDEIQQDLSGTTDPQLDKPYAKEMIAYLEGGGRAMFLPMTKEFLTASRAHLNAPPVAVRSLAGGQPVQATLGTEATKLSPFLSEVNTTYPGVGLWEGPKGEEFIWGIRVGKGTAFLVWDGIIGTNRFIDRAENAQLLVNAIRVLAPKGSRVVFVEAAFGNVEAKGFLSAVAGWLDAAWQQFLLLAAVVIFTLGKRLGLPTESKRGQRGSRELLDALSDTMNRAGAKSLAMRAALDSADQEIRIALKIPRETERARRDEMISPELAKALAVLEASAEDDETPDWDAARRIKKVDEELTAFLAGKRTLRAQRAKIKI